MSIIEKFYEPIKIYRFSEYINELCIMKNSIHTINFQTDSTSHKIQIKGYFSALFFLSELYRKPHDFF